MTVATHVYHTPANPFLVCADCDTPVKRWHHEEECGCESGSYLVPCNHLEAVSLCPGWSPVDGCTCTGAHEL